MKKALILPLVLTLFLIPFISAWDSSLNTGLKGYYTMDSDNTTTATNAVNASNPIIYYVSANQTTGYINNGTRFSASQYGNVSNYRFPTGSGNKTFALWANMTANTNGQALVCGGGDGGVGQGFGLFFSYVGTDSKYWIFGQSADVLANVSTPLSTWHHITVVSEDNKRRLYIDGNLVGNNSATFATSDRPISIGISCWGNGKLNGVIDELAFFNVALNQTEITSLYTNGQYSVASPTPAGSLNVTLNLPNNGATSSNSTVILNATVTPTYANLTNATFYVYNSTALVYTSSSISLSGNTSANFVSSQLNVANGTYHWNAKVNGINETGGIISAYPTSNFTFTISDTWFDRNYEYCFDLNVSGGSNALTWFESKVWLSNSTLVNLVNTTTWGNLRFVNASCNNRGSLIDYVIDDKNATRASFYLGSPLSVGANQFSVYIDANKSLTASENASSVFRLYSDVFLLNEGFGNVSRGVKNKWELFRVNVTGNVNSSVTSRNIDWDDTNSLGRGVLINPSNVGNNGGSDCLISTINTTSELGGTSNRSFMVWSKLKGEPSNLHGQLVALGWSTSGASYNLRYEGMSGTYKVNYNGGEYDTSLTSQTNTNFIFNEYASGTTYFRLNNTSGGSGAITINTASAPIQVGGAFGVNLPFTGCVAVMNGSVFEVRVANQTFGAFSTYTNRTALNDDPSTYTLNGYYNLTELPTPPVTPPTPTPTPTGVTGTPIYITFESIGAGLAVFFDFIGEGLFVLIIMLAIVGAILGIIYIFNQFFKLAIGNTPKLKGK